MKGKQIKTTYCVNRKKLRKYDELANELGLLHGCKIKIITHVITWDGINFISPTKLKPDTEEHKQIK
ncbi:hypothetical protein NAPIS_ORF00374 [Vairimorpha apis BRL 01]|uniref:Uncharacterized protein n=1 Tax=Vairimorpha apis BRL 01 TaxID=1037528 RepID=T0MM16_9MICR|nr:hypothetical protein NAPIS_ORF00374 [Vairimorpha apis BRL 01]